MGTVECIRSLRGSMQINTHLLQMATTMARRGRCGDRKLHAIAATDATCFPRDRAHAARSKTRDTMRLQTTRRAFQISWATDQPAQPAPTTTTVPLLSGLLAISSAISGDTPKLMYPIPAAASEVKCWGLQDAYVCNVRGVPRRCATWHYCASTRITPICQYVPSSA